MTAIADAGPLIALAKIGGLEPLRRLHPRLLVPPAVFHEVVEAGLERGDPDAKDLSLYAAQGNLVVTSPRLPAPAPWRQLGAGEQECLNLAIEQRADWLLIDDWEARQVAERELAAGKLPTQVRGTLGVLVAARLAGHLTSTQTIELVQRIRQRPDIWISAVLCDQVVKALTAARA